MNRLTKTISLVLVSSSLALFGCGQDEQRLAEKEEFAGGPFGSGELVGGDPGGGPYGTGGPYNTGSGGSSSYYSHYHGGVHYFGGAVVHSGPSTFSSRSGSSFSGSSFGGSSRGGFGASAHASSHGGSS